MLVLSRKANEGITVTLPDGEVVMHLVITEIRADKAKIGIVADKKYTVDRDEIWIYKIQQRKLTEHGSTDSIV